MDYLLQEIYLRLVQGGTRFKAQHLLPFSIASLTEDTMGDIYQEFNTDLAAHDEETFMRECRRWKTLCEATMDRQSTIIDTLASTNSELYPNVTECLHILLSMPVSTANAERSVSSMRRLKAYLRSTMTTERLSVTLSMISITAETDMPKCVTEMIGKPGFVECLEAFSNVLIKFGDLSSQAADKIHIMKTVYCSDEGQAALRCMGPHIQGCLELVKEIYGVNLTALVSPGMWNLEDTCTLITGPCSEITECITLESDKVQVTTSPPVAIGNDNNTLIDSIRDVIMKCGPLQNQMDCLKGRLKTCQPESEKSKSMIKLSMEMVINLSRALNTDDRFTKCDDKLKDFGSGCAASVLQSNNFLNCYRTAFDKYTLEQQQNEDSCSLYNMLFDCLNESVGIDCGSSHARYIRSNIKNVQAYCTDFASSSNSVNRAAMTFLVIDLLRVFIA